MTVFIRILRQARPYWGSLLSIFLLSILSAPLALLQPLPIIIVVDYAIGSEPFPEFISSLVPAGIQNSGALVIAAAALLLFGLTLYPAIRSPALIWICVPAPCVHFTFAITGAFRGIVGPVMIGAKPFVPGHFCVAIIAFVIAVMQLMKKCTDQQGLSIF